MDSKGLSCQSEAENIRKDLWDSLHWLKPDHRELIKWFRDCFVTRENTGDHRKTLGSIVQGSEDPQDPKGRTSYPSTSSEGVKELRAILYLSRS
ncbi:hypothetical protein NPIL_267051 [Nephila pilipes]|uniref:Uncharacterized protein n=1 Tax=Nephila pilipes TaxID=299642 RepID=A0A8X6Q824_NEPPI|nr:hypothetical protein NPIL_267051 [Nephila pilipes]